MIVARDDYSLRDLTKSVLTESTQECLEKLSHSDAYISIGLCPNSAAEMSVCFDITRLSLLRRDRKTVPLDLMSSITRSTRDHVDMR